jgi:hypothetical protein
MASLVICASLATGLSGAQSSGHDHQYEQLYYNGESYLAINPGGHSANPNQLVFECFNLGPDLNDTSADATRSLPTLYAVLWPGATQHRCPDGTFTHDHVATALPGTPGFSPHWRAVFVIPVSEDVALPLTSSAAIEAAAQAGQVVLIDTGLIINGPVVHRSGL